MMESETRLKWNGLLWLLSSLCFHFLELSWIWLERRLALWLSRLYDFDSLVVHPCMSGTTSWILFGGTLDTISEVNLSGRISVTSRSVGDFVCEVEDCLELAPIKAWTKGWGYGSSSGESGFLFWISLMSMLVTVIGILLSMYNLNLFHAEV